MSSILIFVMMFLGFWILFGAIFFTIGMVMLNNRKKKVANCTSKTYGKIMDIVRREKRDSDGGYTTSWHPIFEYNIGELKFIKESPYGRSKSKYAIGQEVEVYYNPGDYNECYIAGETLQKTLGTIFIIVGICVVIMSVFAAILILLLSLIY